MKTYKSPGLALFWLLFVLVAPAQGTATKCGTWRWPVKTVTDPGGAVVVSKKPVPFTLDALVTEKPPKVLHSDNHYDGQLPRYSSENQVVEILAYVIEVKHEADDGDLHFVFRSAKSDKTMVGEIPDPACPDFDKYPELKARFTKIRQDGNAIWDQLKKTHAPVKVRVTGVPFWDGVHSTTPTGASKYCREIHPILTIVAAQ